MSTENKTAEERHLEVIITWKNQTDEYSLKSLKSFSKTTGNSLYHYFDNIEDAIEKANQAETPQTKKRGRKPVGEKAYLTNAANNVGEKKITCNSMGMTNYQGLMKIHRDRKKVFALVEKRKGELIDNYPATTPSGIPIIYTDQQYNIASIIRIEDNNLTIQTKKTILGSSLFEDYKEDASWLTVDAVDTEKIPGTLEEAVNKLPSYATIIKDGEEEHLFIHKQLQNYFNERNLTKSTVLAEIELLSIAPIDEVQLKRKAEEAGLMNGKYEPEEARRELYQLLTADYILDYMGMFADTLAENTKGDFHKNQQRIRNHLIHNTDSLNTILHRVTTGKEDNVYHRIQNLKSSLLKYSQQSAQKTDEQQTI